MFKMVKKLRHRKGNKKERKSKVRNEDSDDSDIINNNMADGKTRYTKERRQEVNNQRCESIDNLYDKTKPSLLNRFKKNGNSNANKIAYKGERRFSKSMTDLTMRNSESKASLKTSSSSKMEPRHLKKISVSSVSSRSSVNSLGALRENRRSVMSKLDSYINHVKKSVDEDNISYVPNRLCCAQLLLTVYQMREQACINRHRRSIRPGSLQPQPTWYSSSTSDLTPSQMSANSTRTGSLQNFQDMASGFDSRSLAPSPLVQRVKVTWQQGSDSECSSLCGGDLQNSNVRMCDSNSLSDTDDQHSSCDEEEDIVDNFDAFGECNNSFSSSRGGQDTHDFHCRRGISTKAETRHHRKSTPLFPSSMDNSNGFDIY